MCVRAEESREDSLKGEASLRTEIKTLQWQRFWMWRIGLMTQVEGTEGTKTFVGLHLAGRVLVSTCYHALIIQCFCPFSLSKIPQWGQYQSPQGM